MSPFEDTKLLVNKLSNIPSMTWFLLVEHVVLPKPRSLAFPSCGGKSLVRTGCVVPEFRGVIELCLRPGRLAKGAFVFILNC